MRGKEPIPFAVFDGAPAIRSAAAALQLTAETVPPARTSPCRTVSQNPAGLTTGMSISHEMNATRLFHTVFLGIPGGHDPLSRDVTLDRFEPFCWDRRTARER